MFPAATSLAKNSKEDSMYWVTVTPQLVQKAFISFLRPLERRIFITSAYLSFAAWCNREMCKTLFKWGRYGIYSVYGYRFRSISVCKDETKRNRHWVEKNVLWMCCTEHENVGNRKCTDQYLWFYRSLKCQKYQKSAGRVITTTISTTTISSVTIHSCATNTTSGYHAPMGTFCEWWVMANWANGCAITTDAIRTA